MENTMSIQEAAEKALALQDGCNLSGIAHTLCRILSEAIWPAARAENEGTRYVNSHPIVTVILDKLVDLNGGFAEASAAYDTVKRLAQPAAAPKPILLCRFCGKPECECGSPKPAAE